MKLIFELSGENPTLPFAELGCVGTVLDQRLQVAIVESPDPNCSTTSCHDPRAFLSTSGNASRILQRLRISCGISPLKHTQPFAGRAKKVHGGSNDHNPCSQKEFERMIGTMISGPVFLKNPEVEYRAILSEDRCYFGKVLFTFDRGSFDVRNPGNGIFFIPA